jgi:4'-phosphopantetheinyl transferase
MVAMAATAEQPWTPMREAAPIAPGELHVWRVSLGDVDDGLAGLLSAEERERAARLARPGDGARWMRARGVLRELLGGYLERDPRALVFRLGEHGKPALASAELHFNLAHSRDLAVYAFSLDGDVGVDVEYGREGLDVLGVARRVFGEADAARLHALPLPDRRRRFLRAWVRHEARLKWAGAGVFTAASPLPRAPWLGELDVGPGAAAAVAAAGAPRALRLWEYRGLRPAGA